MRDDALRHPERVSLPHESMLVGKEVLPESFGVARIGFFNANAVDGLPDADIPQQGKIDRPDRRILCSSLQREESSNVG